MSKSSDTLRSLNLQCLAKLFVYARRYRPQLVLGVLLGLVASGAECGQVVMLKQAVEAVTGSAPLGDVFKWVSLLAACAVAAILTGTAHSWRMSVTSQRLVLDLQNDVHRKLHTLSEHQMAQFSPGEFAHLTLQETAAAQQAVGLVIGTLMRHPATVLALACYLVYLDTKTAVLALLGYGLVLVSVRLLNRNLQGQARQLQESRASIHQRFLNLLEGRDLLRCFDTSGQLIESFPQANDAFHQKASHYITRKSTVAPLGRVMGIGFVIALVCYTAWQLREGRISAGTAAAIAASLIAFYRPVSRLAGFSTALIESLASAQRVFDILNLPSYWQPCSLQTPSDPIRCVEFSNVEQAFDDRNFRLRALNFLLKAGQVTLLIGPSGSGKSTLVKLLTTSLRPSRGNVLLNNTPATDLSQQWLHNQLAYLPQGCPVLGRTIREDIVLGRKNVLSSELEDAARSAEILEWIHSLPQGWETPVGPSGMCISGGQQQRLALARVFLSNCSLYVLDEPTAHLDRATERRVIERLCRRVREGGAIGVIVSHRTTLMKYADCVLAVRDGSVVELSQADRSAASLEPFAGYVSHFPAMRNGK